MDACDDTYEAEEKLTALIERPHIDAVKAERLRKERDDLLRVVEELHTGTELAHQEHANDQQRINHLEGELQRERDLNVAAEGMSTGLAMEVDQHQEAVRHLENEVTQQRDEVCRLWADVDGKSLVSLVVFLPRIRGKPFDTVSM